MGEESKETPPIEERLRDLDKQNRRLRFSLRLKVAVTIILLVGAIFHMALVYRAASSLTLEDKNLSGFVPGSEAGTYVVTVDLTFNNPTSTAIDIDALNYEIFVEGDYLGKGGKGGFSIPPGTETHDFSITIALEDLTGPTLTLITQETATIRITGDVTIPVKAFGLFRWKTLTLPFDMEDEVSTTGGGQVNAIPPSPVVLQEPATNTVDSTITLSWSMNTDVDFSRYEVHMSTDPGFTPSAATLQANIDAREEITATLTPTAHLTTYYFKVRVVDDQGLHSDSNEVFTFYV